ncbi:MAG: helix-turn-helix transcriptional regulator [Clostridia bacterium]|nr:helix-turn-helix transcriptional regulator [Clostridia bacterium]
MYRQQAHQEYPGLAPFDMKISYIEITSEDPANEYNTHVHPECEVYINLSGNVSFMVEQRLYPILPGSIILTRPYEYHHCIYHSDELHKHFWILFSAQGNERLLSRFFDRTSGEGNLLILPPKEQNELLTLCRQMLSPASSDIEEYERFFTFLRLLNSSSASVGTPPGYDETIAFALSYMDEHVREHICMKELAREAHVSLNTLERHFSELFGMSPLSYLKKKRLAFAASVLFEGGSVLEACTESGFSDYSNFIRLFRENYGMTPLQYKKKVAKSPSSP